MNKTLSEMTIPELVDLRKDLEVIFEMTYQRDEDTTPVGERAEQVLNELKSRMGKVNA